MVFERFTPEVRKALFISRQLAESSGLAEIAPEHVLAGVLTVASECIGSGHSAAVLGVLGPPHQAHRQENPPEFIPFSTGTTRCLTAAGDRATQLGHRWVRSEHLLAALLLDSSTDAAKALRSAGVTAHALEASALSRPPVDTDPIAQGPTLHTFVASSREH